MRIAHVITRMILGGAQENTLLNCRDLIHEFGDDVLLLTGPTAGPEGSLMESVREEGIPHKVLDALRRPIRPWQDVKAYIAIRRALRDFAPEVVHTHSAKGGILGRFAAASLHIPAIIHTVHGAPFYEHQNPVTRGIYQFTERRAATRCHALISVADAMTDLMTAADVAPKEKFTTIYSGMDVHPFCNAEPLRAAKRTELGYRDDDIVVGKIARLFQLKGHEYLIDAADTVIAKCPNVRFLLVGDGLLRDKLEQDIARRGLGDHFTFAGLVQPDEIPALIAAMDVVVHTSLREGLARVLPQALLTRRPVVSFDIHGAREVVHNDETGFLVAPCRTDQLAKSIIELTNNPSMRSDMGKRGQQLCQHRFDHLEMTRQIREVYASVLTDGRDLSVVESIR